jgi:hypothetical protein
MEWLLIFAITTGIAFIPYSLTQGYITRWKAVASPEETTNALHVLNKARVLIPDDQNNYRYDAGFDKPVPIPHNIKTDAENMDIDLFSTQYSAKKGIVIKGYVAPSLLFYKDYKYEYYYAYYHSKSSKRNKEYITADEITKIGQQETVKEWLREGEKDSIYTVMKEFDGLRKKHNLKFGLTPDKWFDRIYNPPFFPVTGYNLITGYEGDSYDYDNETAVACDEDHILPPAAELPVDSSVHVNSYPYDYSSESAPCLPYHELTNGYEQILKCYQNGYETENIALLCLCLSLAISIFIFSFRVTGGKPWLIALIASGVLVFIVSLAGVSIRELIELNHDEVILILMCLFWIALFFGLLIRVIFKISAEDHKGKSPVYTNMLIWLLPCLIPVSFLIYAIYIEYSSRIYSSVQDEDIIRMFRINILFTILAMWPLSAVIRRWKSLPEE